MKNDIRHAHEQTGPGGNRSNEQGMTIESLEQPGNSYHLTVHRSFIKTVPVHRSLNVRTRASTLVRVINSKNASPVDPGLCGGDLLELKKKP